VISALERENAELRAQLSALAEQLTAHFTRTIDELTQQIAKLNDRVAELTAAAQRRHQRPRGAKPTEKTAAPPPNLSAEAKDAFANRPQPPSLPPKITKQKKPRKPSGRKALPSHLPVDETSLRPEVCDACGGGELDVADEIVEEKLHVVKEHQRRRVVRRTTCRCRKCGSRTTPRSLPAPYERSKVTCEWLAWLIHQKFSMLAPLDRVRRDLLERGIPLAMGTLVGFVERAADLLATVDGEHWKQLLASEWMATDGTGIKVLVPSLPEAHDGYIEQYRNDDVVCFQYEATKDGEIVANKLSSFEGVLTANAEHRFNGVYMSGRVIEAGCNAHGRRKFRDAEETQPTLAAEGGAFISAMYVEEQKARALGLKETALLQHRQQHTRPIADAFDNWLRSVDETLLPSDPLKTAVRYYRNHREALYRFIDDARVPIDNSPTEREFQNVAKLRLNMLFAGSTEGAHRACVLLGIVASCRTARVPVEEYLAWAFERLGTHRDAYNLPAAQLTPAAFKRATTTTK
jgi:transposase